MCARSSVKWMALTGVTFSGSEVRRVIVNP